MITMKRLPFRSPFNWIEYARIANYSSSNQEAALLLNQNLPQLAVFGSHCILHTF
jgi:hypothetical protein